MTKTCSKCGTAKDITEFKRDGTKPDGRYPSCKSCNRAYWALVREQMSNKRRGKRAQDPEKYRRQNILNWKRNNETCRKSKRNWNKNNPEYIATQKRERKRQVRRAAGSHTPQQFRSLVEFYGNRCLCCGVSDGPRQSAREIVRDHVIPLSAGGSNGIENIQPLCRACNTRKRSGTIDFRPRAAMAA